MTPILHINLSTTVKSWSHQGRWDHRRLDALLELPDGAIVVVDVGDRQHVTEDAARDLHAADSRLVLQVVARNPTTLRRFYDAVIAGTTMATA